MIEIWKFFPDTKGKVQYKIYAEDKGTINKLLQLSGVRTSATYCDSRLNFVGMDLILPADRIKAVYKLTGIKKKQIKFL